MSLYLCQCEDLDTYKKVLKDLLLQWCEGMKDKSEWLIVFVAMGANERFWGGSGMASTSSASSASTTTGSGGGSGGGGSSAMGLTAQIFGDLLFTSSNSRATKVFDAIRKDTAMRERCVILRLYESYDSIEQWEGCPFILFCAHVCC